MIAAFILVVAMVALGQFAIYYWRALLAGMAAEPLSQQARELTGETPGSGDLELMLCFQKMCPELERGGREPWAVKLYGRMLAVLRRACDALLPAMGDWAGREMAVCSRYVAVMLDQRMTRNQNAMAAMRSS